MRATPQWDDGKVARCRQYEVAQERLAAGVSLKWTIFRISENQIAS
jgi:hypothetical protein